MNRNGRNITLGMAAASAANILMNQSDVLQNIQDNELTNYINAYDIHKQINTGHRNIQRTGSLQDQFDGIHKQILVLLTDKYILIDNIKNNLVKVFNSVYSKKYNEYVIQCRNEQVRPCQRDHTNTQRGKSNTFAFSFISVYLGSIKKEDWSKQQYIAKYASEIKYFQTKSVELLQINIGTEEDPQNIEFEHNVSKITETYLRQTGQWMHKYFSLTVVKDIRSNSNTDKLDQLFEDDSLVFTALKSIKIDAYDWFLPFTKIKNTNRLYKIVNQRMKKAALPVIDNNKSNEFEEHLLGLQSQIDMAGINSQTQQTDNEQLQTKYTSLEIRFQELKEQYDNTIEELGQKEFIIEMANADYRKLEAIHWDLEVEHEDAINDLHELEQKFETYKNTVQRQSNLNGLKFQQTSDLIVSETNSISVSDNNNSNDNNNNLNDVEINLSFHSESNSVSPHASRSLIDNNNEITLSLDLELSSYSSLFGSENDFNPETMSSSVEIIGHKRQFNEKTSSDRKAKKQRNK